MVTGQFFGFQKIAQSVFDSKSCTQVDPKDRYACIQDKINYCTSTSLGNPLFVAQNDSCFTSRGVPVDGSKAICLMPPTANPYAATVGSLCFGLGAGLVGYELGGGLGSVAGAMFGLPIGFYVGAKLFGTSRKPGPCPSYSKDVPCSAFAANGYNSSSKKTGGVFGPNLKCGGANQGGAKCKSACCDAQRDWCNKQIYITGSASQCAKDRGC